MNNKINVKSYKVDNDTGNLKPNGFGSIKSRFLIEEEIKDIINLLDVDTNIAEKDKITSSMKRKLKGLGF